MKHGFNFCCGFLALLTCFCYFPPQAQILAERASLFDYELIVGDNGKRLLAFGKFAGRVGMIDFLRGLGQRKFLIVPVLVYGIHVEWHCLEFDFKLCILSVFLFQGF